MKILSELAKRLRPVEKADPGIYVSRPLLNAKEWAKWAVAAGVPSPVPAEEMHVTICASPIRVNMKPETEPLSFTTDGACVCLLGKDESALAVVFRSWILLDRWYDFRAVGALGSWDDYTPHVTLSYAAADFQISDEALAAMPDMVILGGEVYAPFGKANDDDVTDDGDDEMDEVDVILVEAAMTASPDLSLIDEIAFRKAIRSGEVPAAVAKRLMPSVPAKPKKPKGDKMPDAGMAKTREQEVVMTVRALPEELRSQTKAAELFKANEEERLVIGWASVSTVKGVLIEDLQGDTITVKAQRQFLHSLIRGQRAGKFEHIGKVENEIVEGMIMDEALQKALGIDLGMEGMLVATHVPDDQNWQMVKSGDWMYSIAGTVLVLEEE